MEQVVVWQKMVEKWREAASEVAQPALKRCYRERAAAYERLVADQRALAAQPHPRQTRGDRA